MREEEAEDVEEVVAVRPVLGLQEAEGAPQAEATKGLPLTATQATLLVVHQALKSVPPPPHHHHHHRHHPHHHHQNHLLRVTLTAWTSATARSM